MTFRPSAHPGILHRYLPQLTAFEFETEALKRSSYPPTLLFIGGLGDGLLTTPYIVDLLKIGWAVAQVSITSSNFGWGSGDVHRDAKELSKCISYFKTILGRPKVVVIGHSTGCQDTLHYLCRLAPEEQAEGGLDGAILQAPVSDREALILSMGVGKWDRSWKAAKKLIDSGKGEDTMSLKLTEGIFGGSYVSANRWYSLSSPNHDSADDFFSSDTPTTNLHSTFGAISPTTTPLLILYSGADEFVPTKVDKKALVKRWVDVCVQHRVHVDVINSGVIEGATHDLRKVDDGVKEEFKLRISEFLKSVDRGQLYPPMISNM